MCVLILFYGPFGLMDIQSVFHPRLEFDISFLLIYILQHYQVDLPQVSQMEPYSSLKGLSSADHIHVSLPL